jgi:protein TonB
MPRFVYAPKPRYPRLARQRGWEGTVVLNVELLADGTVGDVTIAESSGYPLLDRLARDAVKSWRHEPAKRDGTPITQRVTQPFRWTLE